MKNGLKSNKGITLIALVITIIVLLILAGVAISMLAGDNGILRQAANAKERTNKSSIEEKLSLAYLTSISNVDGEVDYDILNEETKKIGYIGGKITRLPADIEIKGEHYALLEDGEAIQATWYYKDDDLREITNGTTTVKFGDKIEYNPEIDEKGQVVTAEYVSPKEKNGYKEQKYDVSGANGKEWVILGIEGGEILIAPTTNVLTESNSNRRYYLGYNSSTDSSTDVKIKCSQAAYVNAESELDKIGEVYGHGKGASGGRSIKVEDVNKVTGYNPNNVGTRDVAQTGNGTKYGSEESYEYENEVEFYWQGTDSPYYKGRNGKTGSLSNRHTNGFYWYEGGWKKSAKSTTATTDKKEFITKLKSTDCWYYPETLTENQNNTATIGIENGSKEYNILFKETYWLSSTYVYISTSYTGWGVRCIDSGCVNVNDLFGSSGQCSCEDGGVRPAISLKSDIKLSGSSVEGWTIE